MGKNKTPKRNGFNMQKIYKYLRIGAFALPGAAIAISPIPTSSKIEALSKAYFAYSPYHKKFNLAWAAEGWAPLLFATVATYGIPKIAGLIRRG